MVYLWFYPENYANRDIGEYNRDCSPDRFLLQKGRQLKLEEFSPVPTVDFIIPQKRLLKFDCLFTNALVPLVNSRIKLILEHLAPDDVQFFPAKCVCTDGILEGYFYLNITHFIIGIDHEKSIYTKMKIADAISGFKYLTYKSDCLGKHHLARDQEYEPHLLASEKVKAIFDKERITGVRLVRPEDYYRPLGELL